MTDQKNNTLKTSSAMPVIVAVLVVLGVIVIAGLYASNQKIQGTEQKNTAVADTPATPTSEDIVISEETSESPPITINPTTSRVDDGPYAARIIGDPNAPLKISEHSSFTCGACKHFHEGNYIKIKKDYINTGKAYVVFNDFPRNYLDMHVGAIARCLPDDVYFNFTQLMFETQEQWADPKKYVDYMKQNTNILGLSEEKFEECLDSEEIHKIITGVKEAAYNTHNVNATPTLVLNDSITVSGLTPYEDLKKTFDNLIAAAEKEKSSEETTPEEIQEVTPEEITEEPEE